jgi:hypothetical protein
VEGERKGERDGLEKKTLLGVDGRFRFWRDVGLGDKLAGSLVIASLFAIVQDVNVEPGWEREEHALGEIREKGGGGRGVGVRRIGEGGRREREIERRRTFYRHPR